MLPSKAPTIEVSRGTGVLDAEAAESSTLNAQRGPLHLRAARAGFKFPSDVELRAKLVGDTREVMKPSYSSSCSLVR